MSKIMDIAGQKFGRLTVLEFSHIGKTKNKRGSYWRCLCECSNIVIKNGNKLKSGDTRSCGCLVKEHLDELHKQKFRRIDLSGQTIGSVVVGECIGQRNKTDYWYKCKCLLCGFEFEQSQRGIVKSDRGDSCVRCRRWLVGKTFGYLEVLEKTEERRGTNAKYKYICHRCGKEDIVSGGRFFEGRFSCGCIKVGLRGKNHPNYDDNMESKFREKSRSGIGVWRSDVLARDRCICQVTGLKFSKCDLEAHHLCAWTECKELRFDVDNGITLHRDIHDLFHSLYGLGYNTPSQFEDFKRRISLGEFDTFINDLKLKSKSG